jgi:choline dehydrogenase
VDGYDYIVAGGGSAGCVVAARLAQDPGARVLLLEAGSSERTRATTVPSAWPENLGSAADWANFTIPQAEAGALTYPRGRVLGGSGAINGMAHVRGHRGVYDDWAANGAKGWAFADLLPYFRRAECAAGRDPGLRGQDGPIRVAPVPEAKRHPVAAAFAAALIASGCQATDDLSGPNQEGACWVDLAIADGERVSSAEGYVRPMLGSPNLVVQADCLVTTLRVTHGRCTGVSYTRAGAPAEARCSGEVVLCAGAIGSPQLLMLSGIGPADQLRGLGIDPVADLADVGQNLHDHPIAMMSYATENALPVSQYNHGEMYAAVRSGLGGTRPDLHLFPILFPLAPAGMQAPPTGYALVASVIAPESRGSVQLASADPQASPLIDPGLLRNGRDVDALAAGMAFIRQATSGRGFWGELSPERHREIYPGPGARTDAGVRDFIRHTVGSYFHPVGTCRLGQDERAVVDAQLRVQGVDGLRVADASVMPAIPNAHPNATVLAIAERAADLITSWSRSGGYERARPPRPSTTAGSPADSRTARTAG